MKKGKAIWRRLLSLLLAVLLLFGTLPAQAFADGTSSKQVTLTISYEDTVLYPKTALEVENFDVSLPENGGYTVPNSATEPTVLNALIQAHKDTFDDFADHPSSYLDVGDSGFMSVVMGMEQDFGKNIFLTYYVNGKMVDETVNDCLLEDGDNVEVTFSDYTIASYTYFTQNTATVEADAPLTLTLMGYSINDAMMGTGMARPMAGATVLVDSNGTGYPDTPKSDWVTDEKGQVTVSFPQPGKYTLSATRKSGDAVDITMPWCVVDVTAGPSEADRQQLVEADLAQLTLSQMVESDLILATVGVSGKTEIDWSSDHPDVVSKDGRVTKQPTDTEVQLTATVSYGSATAKKIFVVQVPALSEAECAASVAAAKTLLEAGGTLKPKENVDTNILEMIEGRFASTPEARGVIAVIKDVGGQTQIDGTTGAITYGEKAVRNQAVVFTLSRGAVTAESTVKVSVAAHRKTKQELIDGDTAALGFASIQNGNSGPDQITGSLKLPTVGSSYETSIQWTSDRPEIISSYGSVKRPAYGQANVPVTLRAEVSYALGGNAPGTVTANGIKEIPVTVLALTQEEYEAARQEVDQALEGLTGDQIRLMGESAPADLSAVTYDLQLASAPYGITTTWTSENTAITINTLRGKVARPKMGEADVSGPLTVTLSKGGYTAEKSFDVTVKALTAAEIQEEQAVMDAVQKALNFDVIKKDNREEHAVMTNLAMVYRGFYDAKTGAVTWKNSNQGEAGIKITWESSDESVIKSYGIVTKPNTGSTAVTMTATLQSIRLNGVIKSKQVPLTLTVVAEAPEIDVAWPSFRGENNSGVISEKTPRYAAEAKLKWQTKLMTQGWNFSTPIITEDALFAATDSGLHKVNRKTGEIIKTAPLQGSIGFTPYLAASDGLVFVPLEKGQIQAFDAETMETRWVSEPISTYGESLSPIVVDHGKLYTGTTSFSPQNQEAFFCLSTQDGSLVWKHEVEAGKSYYWAGAVVSGDAVVVGSNGGNLTSFDRTTGEVRDTYQAEGDIKCAILLEGQTLYFTTGAGNIYALPIEEDGTFQASLAKSAKITPQAKASTSTPVMANGRIYVGAQKEDFSGVISVLDGTTLKNIYDIPMLAYPQCSLLLTTGYQDRTYLYATYNKTPGGLVVIEDFPGNQSPRYSELFTPSDDGKNYCISSPIADQDGTLYYKNDSGNVFAIGLGTPTGSPVQFSTVPYYSDIEVQKDGTRVTPAATGSYDLTAGDYTYTVSKEGYVPKTGKFTVSESDVNGHVVTKIPVSLASESSGGGSEEKKIQVSFTLQGDSNHGEGKHEVFETWLPGVQVTVDAGATVFDVLNQALTTAGIDFDETSRGYIGGIKAPEKFGGAWLYEFANGPKSGWVYDLNGVQLEVGIRDQEVKNGDRIVFHYTDDYSKEPGADKWNGSGDSQDNVVTGDAVIKPTVSSDANGRVSSSATDAQIKAGVTAALSAAKKLGKKTAVVEIQMALPNHLTRDKATAMALTLPKDVLSTLTSDKKLMLVVTTPFGTVTLQQAALASLQGQAKEDIKLTIVKAEAKEADAKTKELLGDRPIYEITFVTGTMAIHSLGGNAFVLSIPYTPTSDEKTNRLFLYYIDANGRAIKLTDSKYNETTKAVEGTSDHLSLYGIGYEQLQPQIVQFGDVPRTYWAAPYIYELADRGLMSGVGKGRFAPAQTMCRGELITVLARMSGADLDQYQGKAFSDVEENAWYAPAAAWAKENGIAEGIHDRLYPNEPVTRQDMAVLLARYAEKVAHQTWRPAQATKDFADAAEISNYAKAGVAAMVDAGVIDGRPMGRFAPKDGASRAEAAKMIATLFKVLKQ